MADNKVVVKKTFPVLGVLGIILVTLKALGLTDLAWLWVLLPFWGPLAVALIFFVGGAICVGLTFLLALAVETYEDWRRKR